MVTCAAEAAAGPAVAAATHIQAFVVCIHCDSTVRRQGMGASQGWVTQLRACVAGMHPLLHASVLTVSVCL